MGALANHPFVKMNGLGNEIVVVDMRGETGAVSAADARAAAQPQGVPFDQLMALYAPRTVGTDDYVPIYNSDGSEAGACGNGMRCVAECCSRKRTGALTFETSSGILNCWKEMPLTSTVDMEAPRFAGTRFRSRRNSRIPRDRAAIGPIDAPVLHSPSALSMETHAVFWSRTSADTTSADRPRCRASSHVPGTGQPRWRRSVRERRGAHLGTRRRTDEGVRLGCLRAAAVAAARLRRTGRALP
jgi:diaminopimelate epimerase